MNKKALTTAHGRLYKTANSYLNQEVTVSEFCDHFCPRIIQGRGYIMSLSVEVKQVVRAMESLTDV